MLFLTTMPQGDPVALIMVLCLLAVVAVLTLRRYLSRRRAASVPAAAESAAPSAPAPEAPGSAGHILLHGVNPRDAAMAMAIVANSLGRPLNTLRFISIKEIEKNEV